MKENLAVQRFDVVAMSREFLELARELPEISTAPFVERSGKRIEGEKVIMVASSLQEVERGLPPLVAGFADSDKQHVRIIERSGECPECAGKNKPCEHLGRTIMSTNRAYDIDINKIPKTA